jgi:uncharacterized protein
MASGLAIVVMTRSPATGRTRPALEPVLSAEQSATLHLLFLLRTVQRLERMGAGELIVCYDPPEAGEVMPDLMGWIDQSRLIPQEGGEYSDRVTAAVETVVHHRGGFDRVLVLGVDSPDVPEEHVQRTADLTAAADVTVGETEFGGVWCLALGKRVDARKLLRDVPWTGDDAAHAIMGRAKALGYSAQPAPRWNEVDRPEELTRLTERLKTSSDPDDVRLLTELERTVPRGKS